MRPRLMSKSKVTTAEDEDKRQYAAAKAEIDEMFPNRPKNHSKTFVFSELITRLFTPLNDNKHGPSARGHGGRRPAHSPSPHEQRRIIIEKFINKWRTDVGNDFYPALRLILPDKDRDRGMYGMKESVIGKLLIKLIKIDRNSEDGYSLLHWKLPGQASAAGDFALRCRDILMKREMCTTHGTLTIADVNELLDKLAAASGEAENLQILETLYQRMNAEELMWMIRIILRQLKIGATERTFFNVWHPNAEALFSVSSSLRRVCWELWARTTELEEEEVGISLMQPFQPQLAQFQMSTTFDKMIAKLLGPIESESDKEFWIEEKLDGERMQMHMIHDDSVPGGKIFGWWSRKGKDYTYLYGNGLQDNHSAITRHLGQCFEERVQDIILDGEMVTWDPKLRKLVTFGTLKTAAIAEKASTEPDGDDLRPMFCVFDILYLNGAQLSQYTLRDRRNALSNAVKGVSNRLEVHPYKTTKSVDDIEPQLRDVVARSSEGLVIKNTRSMYRLGSRNDDWCKVKPEYMSEFGESLDLVIIGGYYGSGYRGGIISSFMCGLRASQNHITAGASCEKCWSFCKVGGGFKVEDYAEIRAATEGKWNEWDSKRPPRQYIELAGGDHQYEKPDVWIRPSESVVIEIKASSVVGSLQFAIGKTVRFPRFRKLRSDKKWDAGLDIDEFQQLATDAKQEHDKAMNIEDRKKRTAKRVKRDLIIVGTDAKINAEKAPARYAPRTQTILFEGMEFCVLSEASRPHKRTKPQLEALIKDNGGIISQRAVPMTPMIIVAEKNVVKAASLIKAGDVIIIKPKWVLDCISQGWVLPFEQEHLFHATSETTKLADQASDKYGDGYARDVGVDELRSIITNMPKLESLQNPFNKDTLLADLDNRGIDLPSSRGLLFRHCVVHLVNVDDNSTKETRLRNYVRFGTGKVSDSVRHGVTHVVMVGSNATKVNKRAEESLKEVAGSMDVDGKGVARVVVGSWVDMSWREGSLMDEEDFRLL